MEEKETHDKSAVTKLSIREESLCDITKRYRLHEDTRNMEIADCLGLICGDGSLERPFCCFFNSFNGALVAIRINISELIIFDKHEMHKRVQLRMIEHEVGEEIKG